MSFATLLLFFGLLSGVSDPARKLSEIFSRIQRAAAASDRKVAARVPGMPRTTGSAATSYAGVGKTCVRPAVAPDDTGNGVP